MRVFAIYRLTPVDTPAHKMMEDTVKPIIAVALVAVVEVTWGRIKAAWE